MNVTGKQNLTFFVSNGSGKSSLAMAALWALTGSLDPRKAADSKVADIVNDASKVGECLKFGYCVYELLLIRYCSSSVGRRSNSGRHSER